MLQKTFGIYNEGLEGCSLFIEAGMRHLACWCKHEGAGALKAFEFFQFEDEDSAAIDNTLQNIKLQSKLLDTGLSLQGIVWDTPEALCVPAEFYNYGLAPAYLDVMHGEKPGTEVTAQPLEKQVVISRHAAGCADIFQRHFKASEFKHKFYVLLKEHLYSQHAVDKPADALYAIFYPAHFVVTAIKGNNLQFMRSIGYQTSEDALYSIMQVCREYDMPAAPVIVSGLIDTGSNLYNTLYAYLEGFEVEKGAPEAIEGEIFADYPAHYFLPFMYA